MSVPTRARRNDAPDDPIGALADDVENLVILSDIELRQMPQRELSPARREGRTPRSRAARSFAGSFAGLVGAAAGAA